MFQQRRRTKQNPQQVYNHHNANGVGKKITLTYNYDQMGGVGGGVTKRSSIQSPYHHHHHHHHHNPSSNIFRCTLLVVGSLLVCGLLIIVGGGYNNAISLFAGNVGSDTGTTTSSSNIAVSIRNIAAYAVSNPVLLMSFSSSYFARMSPRNCDQPYHLYHLVEYIITNP